MNKLIQRGMLALLVLVLEAVSAQAGAIPAYMEKELKSPKRNICPVICNIMYPNGKVQSSGGAESLSDQQNMLKRKLVADLYAEGLTTRTNMLKKASEDKKKALEGAVSSPMKDKKEVLDDMQPYLISIINHLRSVAALEASIAALEGTIRLTRDSGHSETDVLERCDCEKEVGGQSTAEEGSNE